MIRFWLIAAVTWLYLLLGIAAGLPVFLLTRRLSVLYWVARRGIGLLLLLAGIRVRVVGAPPRGGRVVYMANHQSYLDPPILLWTLPGYPSILAKQELFRVPGLGLIMRLAELVPVERGREAARESVDQAAAMLRAGRPFLVFPEGTRSPDGRLLPFKTGVFVLAQKGAAQVVPVSIFGAHRLLPKQRLRLLPGRVVVRFHPPLNAADFADKEALLAAVRAAIAAGLQLSAAESGAN